MQYKMYYLCHIDIEEECDDDLNIYIEGGRCVLKMEAPK